MFRSFPMRRLAAAALLAACAAAPSRAAPTTGIHVLADDASRLSFVVDAAVTVTGEPGGLRTLAAPGFDLEGFGGAPALPVRYVAVALPPTGDPRVDAIGEEPVVHEGVVTAPALRTPDRPGGPPRSGIDPTAYARREAMRPLRAEVIEVGWMRGQRIARIAIHPADYLPSERRLTTWRRVRVDVSFPPAPSEPVALDAGDPFERTLESSVLNPGQGRAWRRAAKLASARTPSGIEDPVLATTSVFPGHSWIKIAVPATGMYRVDFGQVRGLAAFDNRTTTPVDSVRLFAWNGPSVLPVRTFCDSCDYREIPIGIVDTGPSGPNGVFGDNADYLYFHALGINEWDDRYDPSAPDTNYTVNPYETVTYYFLTVAEAGAPIGGAPRRIAVEPVAETSPDPIEATFPERIHYETDAFYFPNASPRLRYPTGTQPWEQWVWYPVDQGRSFTTSELFAPGADTTQPVRLRASLHGLTLIEPDAAIGCSPTLPDHFADLIWNGQPLPRVIFENYDRYTVDTLVSGVTAGANTLTLQVPLRTDPGCPSRLDRIGLSWVELWYPRRFEPVGDRLAFRSPATPPPGGVTHYRLGPFTSPAPPRVFDVTDPRAPIELQVPPGGFQQTGEGRFLEFARAESGLRRYLAVPGSDSTFTRLAGTRFTDAVLTATTNLRADSLDSEYLIIYYDGFLQAAQTLLDWRTEHLPGDRPAPHRVRRVPISSIYDQFSGGRLDPGAIRLFLRHLYYSTDTTWVPPHFVTLLGDASYDFRNILGRNSVPGQPAAPIPSYEEGWDRAVARQFATDDWMLNVDNSATVSILTEYAGGRIPAGTAAEALDIVRNKVILYEQSAPYDEFRNRVVLLADDNEQGDARDPLSWTHLQQTSELERDHTPAHLDRRYVYLHKFPDGPGGTKPAAKTTFIAELNAGAVLVNYIGHGSPIQLTDEKVFLDSDTGTLTNGTRLAIFIAASCDVGKFNDPLLPSLGERLLTHAGGGAVAVISATELAFSYQNELLNKEIYDRLFARDLAIENGRYHTTLSEALRGAKITGAINDQKYQLLGDAATRPNLPRQWAELTLRDSAGAALTQLARGSRVFFDGRVIAAPGNDSLQAIDGQASVLIEDSAPVELPPGVIDDEFAYRYKAGTIYRGNVQLRGGLFSGSFVVPLDAGEGPNSRARAYVQGLPPTGGETDGAGHVVTAVVSGTGNPADVNGPRIELAFVGGATQVRPDAVLQINLYDESGILTTGRTPQNGIVVTLDDNTTNRADVTSTFRYAADSYQAGTATYTLPNLSPGPHRIRVSAADNLALGLDAARHRTTATLEFEVVASPDLRVTRAYLMPNPAESAGPRGGATFVVDAPGEPVNVLIRVYTASGRLIRTLRSFGGLAQIQLPWDGRDDEGDVLANGTYFFRVHVNGRDDDGSSAAGRRADAEGRFVILNR